MTRGAKTISCSQRSLIDVTKGLIFASRGRWFDSDGHAGKTAVAELRKAGQHIYYCRTRGSYQLRPTP